MDWLLRPTKGRIALWLVLGFLWFLFLPQEIAMDPHQRHVSVFGAVFWAVVLVGLLTCAWMTWRRYREASTRASTLLLCLRGRSRD